VLGELGTGSDHSLAWFKRLQHNAQIRMIAALAGSARRFTCCGIRRLDRSSGSTQHEEIEGGKAAVALVKGYYSHYLARPAHRFQISSTEHSAVATLCKSAESRTPSCVSRRSLQMVMICSHLIKLASRSPFA